MLITDKFIYVHQPKTGGTFVTSVIAAIHEARSDRVETFHLDGAAGWTQVPGSGAGMIARVLLRGRNQHGTRSDIPLRYRGRPLLATIRNPYDRYVSQYEFAWWRVYPEMFGPVEHVRRLCPRYPDLAFDEFVELTNTASLRYKPSADSEYTPGFQTQQFVEYLLAKPDDAYPLLHDDSAWDRLWELEKIGLHLIDQQALRDQLHAFLLQMGYAPGELALVRNADWIRPRIGPSVDSEWTSDYSPSLGAYVERMTRGRSPARDWTRYYTPELKAFVRERERVLFRLFPQFDV